MSAFTLEDFPADPWAFHEELVRRGWSDGLPVIPPTAERVEDMLGEFDAAKSLGPMAPSEAEASNALMAANAVMAGCRPEFFPVVRTAVEAILVPRFNLLGVQTTTHPATPMFVVSGRGADELGVNVGAGCLSPGSVANASIGRAVRLCLLNIGGAQPGVMDRAVFGHPGKYTFVVGENLAAHPWGPLDLGDFGGDDALRVTAMAAEGPHNVSDHESATADEFLTMLTGAISQTGMNNWYYPDAPFVVLLGPEHAGLLVRESMSRADVAEAVRQRARISLDRFPQGLIDRLASRRPDVAEAERGDGTIAAFAAPTQILVVVAGGPGRHSMVVPSFGNSQPVQLRVRPAGG